MDDVLDMIENLQRQIAELLKLEQVLNTRVTMLDTRVAELQNDREKFDKRLHSVEYPHV